VVLFIMLSGNPPFQMARPGDWWFNQFLENRPDRFWKSHKRYSPHFPEVGAFRCRSHDACVYIHVLDAAGHPRHPPVS
jgi:FAD/FMN-containing dehydrogenase